MTIIGVIEDNGNNEDNESETESRTSMYKIIKARCHASKVFGIWTYTRVIIIKLNKYTSEGSNRDIGN